VAFVYVKDFHTGIDGSVEDSVVAKLEAAEFGIEFGAATTHHRVTAECVGTEFVNATDEKVLVIGAIPCDKFPNPVQVCLGCG
jgi:hypothetical protein